ncbi:MAG: RsmB/NOP family class I SAM-dependent RNA methyltransferase [Candidatus Saccharimonadales bacterium]
MTKRKDPTARLAAKKGDWLWRTCKALHLVESKTMELLELPRTQSVRLRYGEKLDFLGKEFPWCPGGYELLKPVSEIRDSEAVRSGQIYIQNAASWLPVIVLDPQADDVILDVCAAPGGKTSHIRDAAGGSAEIWANDNSRARLAKLQSNMKQLNIHINEYTLFDATQLARKLKGKQFTKILLDAPCGGEGMMTMSSNKDFDSWSVAHIKRLQQLQKRILTQAWHLLAPGGTLVYSTCTMAPEENEAVIDYLLRSQPDVVLEPIDIDLPNKATPVLEWNDRQYNTSITNCLRLMPSERIEAFFVCKLVKQV